MAMVMLGMIWARPSAALRVGRRGRVADKHLRQQAIIAFVANLPRCAIAMEACCDAHRLGRRLGDLGSG